MPKVPTLVTQRFRMLLDAMRDSFEAKHGSDYGFQMWAANQTGVHQAQISLMLDGSKGAGAKSAERASQKLRIPPAYFHDPAFDPAPVLQRWRSQGADVDEAPESHLERDDDPAIHDELLAKFLADFTGEFSPEVIRTLRTGVFGADGQRPSSLMGYVKLAQQLEKALAGEVRIVFEPVKK